MASKLKIFYDKKGRTLTVWFGDPKKESVCEETGDEVILMKDKKGKVIGFERLNIVLEDVRSPRVEVIAA